MKIFFWILLFPVVLQAQTLSVSTDSLMKHVNYFASPALNGRLPGTDGFLKAVQYSEYYFEQHELTQVLNDSWQQNIPIETNVIDSARVMIETGRDMLELIPGVDFSVRGYSGSGNVTAPVVFCGYGLDSDVYSDYRDIDVKGKIVLIFKSIPPFFKSSMPDYSIRGATDAAYKHGAVAVIFVSQPNQNHPQEPIGSMMHGAGPMHADLPQIQISVEKAEYLMSNSGYSLKQLQTSIDSLKKPCSIAAKKQASVYVEANYNVNGKTTNIIAMLPGSDPVLKDEYIILGAHLDHVGAIGNTVYYPGANDNASGSVAVLELARIFSADRSKLKRSVIFVLFGSEEKGLDGSTYFVNNLPVPKEKIVAVFNMDCIGCGDSLMAGNGKSCPDLWNMAIGIAQQNKWAVSQRTWEGGGADLKPFYDAGIPGLYFVNTNAHQQLHLPSDTPEILNQPQFSRMVMWVEAVTRKLLM
ncbi:MAG: M20/M25/M40 family metallo-hydrolase [Bacteroidales bacterium]